MILPQKMKNKAIKCMKNANAICVCLRVAVFAAVNITLLFYFVFLHVHIHLFGDSILLFGRGKFSYENINSWCWRAIERAHQQQRTSNKNGQCSSAFNDCLRAFTRPKEERAKKKNPLKKYDSTVCGAASVIQPWSKISFVFVAVFHGRMLALQHAYSCMRILHMLFGFVFVYKIWIAILFHFQF